MIYSVRKARPSEITAALAMLPVFDGAVVADVFVATSEAATGILGAAALVSSRRNDRIPVSWRFAIAVDVAHRRAGIGRALFNAVADEARRAGARRLRAWSPMEDGPGMAFLRALGFAVGKRFLHFDADFSTFYEAARVVRDRLVAGGKIPRSARLLPLGDVPAEKVVRLIRRHLGGVRAQLTESIRGRGDAPWSPQDSIALVVGHQVRGALTLGWEGATPRIYRYVIDPRNRCTWVNVLILTAAMERMLAGGATRVRFSCYEDVRDTVRIAERCGARIEKVESSYTFDLYATRLRWPRRALRAMRSLATAARRSFVGPVQQSTVGVTSSFPAPVGRRRGANRRAAPGSSAPAHAPTP